MNDSRAILSFRVFFLSDLETPVAIIVPKQAIKIQVSYY